MVVHLPGVTAWSRSRSELLFEKPESYRQRNLVEVEQSELSSPVRGNAIMLSLLSRYYTISKRGREAPVEIPPIVMTPGLGYETRPVQIQMQM